MGANTADSGALHFDADVDIRGIYRKIDMIDARMQGFVNGTVKGGKRLDSSFASLGHTIGNFSKVIGPAIGAIAFAKATKDAYQFSVDYQSAMTEVGTISEEIFSRFDYYSDQILDLATKGSQAPKELAKSMYQIVSAGYDGAEGLEVLKTAAISSTAGFVDTAIAADGITTVLNAWGKPFTEAQSVSDTFFKTVEKGKTTFPELAQNIAQIAPIAASLKIPFSEVMGLMATITKQGTPTAQAATQIRSAIVGIAKEYGNAAFEGRKLQETFEIVAKDSNYSVDALATAVGRIEGANAILASTGEKAKMAMSDLKTISEESAGATEKAAQKVEQSSKDITARLTNNIIKAMKPLGDGVMKEISELAHEMNEAFDSGKIEEFFSDFAKGLKISAALLLVYKSAAIGANLSMISQEAILRILIAKESILNRWRKISIATQAAYVAATDTATTTTVGLSKAIKILTASMATNPFTAIVAVLGLATAAYFAFRKEVKSAKDIQEDYNRAVADAKDYDKNVKKLRDEYKELHGKTNKTADEQDRYNELIKTLAKIYPDTIDQVDRYGEAIELSTEKLEQSTKAHKKELIQQYEDNITIAEQTLKGLEAKHEAQRKKTQLSYQVKTVFATGFGAGRLHDVTIKTDPKSRAKAREELAKIQEDIDSVNNSLKGSRDLLQSLSGENNGLITGFEEQIKRISELSKTELLGLKKSIQESLKEVSQNPLLEKELIKLKEQLNSVKEALKGGGGLISSFDLEKFKEQLEKAAQAYDEYNMAVRQGFEDTAKTQYAQQLKQGATYKEYLQNQLRALEGNEQAKVEIIKAASEADISLRDQEKTYEQLKNEVDGLKTSILNANDQEKQAIAEKIVLLEYELTLRESMAAEAVNVAKNEKITPLGLPKNKKLSKDGFVDPKAAKKDKQELVGLVQVARRLNRELKELGYVSPEEKFENLDKALNAIYDIEQAAKAIGDSFAGMNDEIANLANGIGQFANIAGSLASGNYLGAATGVLQIMMAGAVSEEELLAQEAERVRQMFELQNFALREQLRILQESTGDERTRQEQLTLDLIQKQTDELKEYAKEFELVAEKTKRSGLFGWGRSTTGVIFGNDIDTIEEWIALLGDTDDAIAEAFANSELFKDVNPEGFVFQNLEDLQKLIDEYYELIDARRELLEELTQTTSGDIANTITDGFFEGKKSIEDFADDFETLMKNALKNTLKTQYLNAVSKDFFEMFGSLAEGGLTDLEINELGQNWADLITGASEQFEQLNSALQAAGIDLASDLGVVTQQGIAGAIRRELTEETGGELAGLMRKQSDGTRMIRDYNKMAVDHLLKIESNTHNTVVELRNAVTELQAINSNTAKQQTGRDLGV